jgi:ATP-dependent Clp protease adaptor protein ClpS
MSETVLKNRPKTNSEDDYKEPPECNVIILNDDFTTMEIVMKILTTIFHKEELDAQVLTREIHEKGKAIVGTYIYDIAITKREQGLKIARDAGYPLKIIVEEI